MNKDLDTRFELAQKIAKSAGLVARRYFADITKLKIDRKGQQDYVSEADKNVEQHLRDAISAAFPQDAILGEEHGLKTEADGAYCWVLDPIDGTTNFIRGSSLFTICIAVVQNKHCHIGVVYDVYRDELYTAYAGIAQLNNIPIGCSRVDQLNAALIGLGYSQKTNQAVFSQRLTQLMAGGAEFRRLGSAALELAWVAAGRLDGFWQQQLQSWDVLAGMKLVSCAGGLSSAYLADTPLTAPRDVLVAAPGMAKTLADLFEMELIQREHSEFFP